MRLKKISIYFLIASWALMSTGCRWTWLEKIMTLEPKPPPAVTEKYNKPLKNIEAATMMPPPLPLKGFESGAKIKPLRARRCSDWLVHV